MRRIPPPLALLLVLTAVLSVAWAVFLPPFEGPDEDRHFAYVQKLVEQRTIPWRPGVDCGTCARGGSTAFRTAVRESGYAALQGNASGRDAMSRVDERFWNAAEQRLTRADRGDVGYETTLRNPPAYYLYAAVPYVVASGSDLFGQELAIRLAGIPLLLLAVACAWVLTGLLVGERRWLQTLGAGVVALNAQLLSVGSTVNADTMLVAGSSVVLTLIALVLLRGPTRGRLVGLAAATAVTMLSHPRGLSLAVPVAVTGLILLWRATGPHERAARRRALAASVVAALAGAFAVAYAATLSSPTPSAVREFVSYLWQFYLPRLGFMEPAPRSDWGVRQAFVDRFWSQFGQFDVVPHVTGLMAVVALLVVAGLLVLAVVRRAALWRARAVLGTLALGAVVYLLAAHVGAWRGLQVDPTADPVLTGRYLLPFVVLLGVAVAALVAWLPKRLAVGAAGVVLFGALGLQLAALGAVVERFHG